MVLVMPVLHLLLKQSKPKDSHLFTLAFDDISNAFSTSIVEAIKVNKTLTNLRLSGNGVSDAGTTSIAEAIKVNEKTTDLDLSDKDTVDSCATSIAKAKSARLSPIWICVAMALVIPLLHLLLRKFKSLRLTNLDLTGKVLVVLVLRLKDTVDLRRCPFVKTTILESMLKLLEDTAD